MGFLLSRRERLPQDFAIGSHLATLVFLSCISASVAADDVLQEPLAVIDIGAEELLSSGSRGTLRIAGGPLLSPDGRVLTSTHFEGQAEFRSAGGARGGRQPSGADEGSADNGSNDEGGSEERHDDE
ncbi:MAG: hypothetical protein DWQ31_12405 [Planctomycetota bacterium]|nr:MAG: hypothetical protein DWQ31_12405 [Planctomycetota bacterium]REJ89861.1 MAG: hypothetical protein DWQ35_17590 [Planctomycetota bacterium]